MTKQQAEFDTDTLVAAASALGVCSTGTRIIKKHKTLPKIWNALNEDHLRHTIDLLKINITSKLRAAQIKKVIEILEEAQPDTLLEQIASDILPKLKKNKPVIPNIPQVSIRNRDALNTLDPLLISFLSAYECLLFLRRARITTSNAWIRRGGAYMRNPVRTMLGTFSSAELRALISPAQLEAAVRRTLKRKDVRQAVESVEFYLEGHSVRLKRSALPALKKFLKENSWQFSS